MSNSELYSTWIWSLIIAGAVVLIAAALLIAIHIVARRILANAQQALEAVEEIADDTSCIWELDETNRIAAEILATTESIESRGERIVDRLHHTERASGQSEEVRP